MEAKPKGIKKAVSVINQALRDELYVSVYYNQTTNEIWAVDFIDKYSFKLYEDDNIYYVERYDPLYDKKATQKHLLEALSIAKSTHDFLFN